MFNTDDLATAGARDRGNPVLCEVGIVALPGDRTTVSAICENLTLNRQPLGLAVFHWPRIGNVAQGRETDLPCRAL